MGLSSIRVVSLLVEALSKLKISSGMNAKFEVISTLPLDHRRAAR
jgi:hypothetical protein